MKRLTIVRHAKSSWKFEDLDDFSRPLNSRGIKSAPIMAEAIQVSIGLPDIIYCSSAKRTVETFKIFAEKWGLEPKHEFIPSLYLASERTLLQSILDAPESAQHLMLIGHNPGLTDLINYLGINRLDNLPTCGVMQFEFQTQWKDITAQSGKMTFWDYPKAH